MDIVPVSVSSNVPSDFICQFPWRSPLSVAEVVRNIIAGKTVCDLGCGDGDLLRQFAKYAARVFGIERKAITYTGDIRIIQADYSLIEIPNADVFFLWPDEPDMYWYIAKKLLSSKQRCVILLGGRQKYLYLLLEIAEAFNGKVLSFPYSENSVLAEFPSQGLWWICAIVAV